jgi:hypothetical protein
MTCRELRRNNVLVAMRPGIGEVGIGGRRQRKPPGQLRVLVGVQAATLEKGGGLEPAIAANTPTDAGLTSGDRRAGPPAAAAPSPFVS